MDSLIRELRVFAEKRGWGKYHTPKNLAMALSVEASELLEIFQWLTPEESQTIPLDQVEQEVGDVLIYLLMLCDALDLNPLWCARAKLTLNAVKYPIDKR